eukprot:TRINITY_DN730_c0_g1_i1.p1 TRINITY_DN730_c0_g1~~TRINITY_DN730_c0_g1_i1.p1  ORF type:complete len:166 (-),score=22.27 TRINITY_DN730_c0_g1_i1:155-652(-)
MACGFCRCLPPSRPGVVVVPPVSSTCIGGLYSAYEEDFPPELDTYMSPQEYQDAMSQINDTLSNFWPCCYCFSFGWMCCPCTFGLSLLIPGICVRDAEHEVRKRMGFINWQMQNVQHRQVQFQLVKNCCSSWVEVSYGNQTVSERASTSMASNGYMQAHIDDNQA